MLDFNKIDWCIKSEPKPEFKEIFYSKASTTEYFKNRFEIKINVLFSDFSKTLPNEQKYFNSNKVFVRITEMFLNNNPFIFARSCFDIDSSKDFIEQIINLGNKPLGNIIFENSVRSEFEFGSINKLPARKSVFNNNKFKLLLTEIFI